MSFKFAEIAPYLGAVGNELINLDEDLVGADDFAGNLLIYIAEVGTAIQIGKDLPEIPEILKAGTVEKASSGVRALLRIVSTVLIVAQFQVSGKAYEILKYLNQVLRLLIARREVPPVAQPV